MILAASYVSLYEIKNQLKKVYRECRKQDCPKCKEEQKKLEELVDQYGKQMIEITTTQKQ